MGKKSEAELLLKVKSEGKEKLKETEDSFKKLTKSIQDANKEQEKLQGADFSFKDLAAAAAKIVTAITAVTAAIGALVVKSERFEQIKQTFTSLAASQGKDSEQILANMKKMTEGMVSSMDLMVAANKAILLGLPVDRFPEMLKIAKSASEATGESMQFMLDSIVTSLGRQSKLILDNLGIMIDVEGAYDKFAATLGKTASQLTEAEKKTAFINEALRVGVENADNMGAATDNQAKAWARLKVKLEEISVSFGSGLTPIIESVFNWMGRLLGNIQKLSQSDGLLAFSGAMAKSLNFIDGLLQALVIGFEKNIQRFKLLKGYITFNKEDRDAAERNIEALNQRTVELGTETAEKNRKIDENFQRERITRALASGQAIADEDLEMAKGVYQEIAAKDKTKNSAILAANKKRLEAEKKDEQKAIDFSLAERQKELQKKKVAEDKAADEELTAKKQLELDKETAAREAAARSAADQKAQMEEYGRYANTFITSGFQGVAQSAVSQLADVALPGFGAAAGSMFSLLSQDSDKFLETINQLFSVEFLDNIAKNIPLLMETFAERLPELIETLADRLPDIVEKLIEALIENAVPIALALATVFSKPQFIERMVLAIANGFANGTRDGLKNLAQIVSAALKAAWETVKDLFKVQGPNSATGGSSPTSGKGVATAQGGGAGTIVREVGKKLKIKGFNTGGVVPNFQLQKFAAGGTADTVPAMLTPGEFVVNATAAKKNFSTLQSINSGGGGGGMAPVININVNGGLLGDAQTARAFAKAIDSELLKLRQANQSVAFERSTF